MNVKKLKHPKDAKAALAEQKKSLQKLLKIIATKEDNDEDVSVEQAEFDALKEDHEATKERLDELESRVVDLSDDDEKDADEDDKEDKRFKAKSYTGQKTVNINTGAVAKLNPRDAIGLEAVTLYLKSTYGNQKAHQKISNLFGEDVATKAVNKDLLSSTQPVVPQTYDPNLIDLLRAKSFMRSRCDVRYMPNGNLTIPRQIAGTQAFWTAEAAPITPSQINMDSINLLWKKIAALTFCSREMIEYSAIDAVSVIANDLVQDLALVEDQTFLNNTVVTTAKPLGLRGYLTSSNTFSSTVNANSKADFQTISYDMAVLLNSLEANLIDTNGVVLVMNPGVKNGLMQVSSSFGVYPFRDELSQGRFMGKEVISTTLIESNDSVTPAGSSTAVTTGSPILAFQPKDIIIGNGAGYGLESTNQGSFVNAAGQQVNTFGQDLVGWKISNHCDLGVKHTNSIAMLNTTGWSLSNMASLWNSPDTENFGGSKASGAIGKTQANP